MKTNDEQTIYRIALLDAQERAQYTLLFNLRPFFQEQYDCAMKAVCLLPEEQLVMKPLQKIETQICAQFVGEPLHILKDQAALTECEVLRTAGQNGVHYQQPRRVQELTVTFAYDGAIAPLLSWQHQGYISREAIVVTVDTKKETLSLSVDYSQYQGTLDAVKADIVRQWDILTEIVALIVQEQEKQRSRIASAVRMELERRKTRLAERKQVLITIMNTLPLLLHDDEEMKEDDAMELMWQTQEGIREEDAEVEEIKKLI